MVPQVKRSSLGVVGAILVLVLALLPGIAQGEEKPAQLLTSFGLRASNGYLLGGLAFHEEDEGVAPDEEDEEGLLLFLMSPKRHAMVTYATPAMVSDTAIEADLGELGRISVTRVQTGRTKMVKICGRGRKREVAVERYEGTIEFHGEEGFTDVSATSAPLDSTPFCSGRNGGEEGGGEGRHPDKSLPRARLDVEKARGHQYRLEFDAVKERPGAKTRVSVEIEERRGEIGVHRAISLFAAPGALHFSRNLHTATVRPPAPFAGHGSFDGDARGAGRWTGNLTVDLPGHSDVPVTGPGFTASLEHPGPQQPPTVILERVAQRASLVR
jgi:hypothetical protein